MSERKIFFGVLSVKFVLLVLFICVFGVGRLVWSDSALYVDIGRHIFQGHGFSETFANTVGYRPNAIRTPLYPFIVGFFDWGFPYGLVVVSLIQCFIAAGIAVYTYRIGRFWLSERMALIPALFVSFEPLMSAMHILIMPEPLLVLTLLIYLYYGIIFLRERERRAFWGMTSGLLIAIYTKPVALYVVVFNFLFLFWRDRRAALKFCFIVALILSPWVARNYHTFGVLDMTQDDKGNLCSWELTAVMATKYHVDSTNWSLTNPLPEYQSVLERCKSTGAALKIFVTEYPREFIVASALSTAAMLTNEGYSVFFEKPQQEQIKPHHNYLTPPVLVMRDWPSKVLAAARELRAPELVAVIVGKIMWKIIALLSIFGLYMLYQEYRVEALFFLTYITYFISATVVSTGFGVGARLRYPINPLLLILACYATVRIKEYYARKSLS